MSILTVVLMCPSCKEGLEGAAGWAAGFNASIMFMMAMPFAIAAVITGAVIRGRRRQARELDRP